MIKLTLDDTHTHIQALHQSCCVYKLNVSPIRLPEAPDEGEEDAVLALLFDTFHGQHRSTQHTRIELIPQHLRRHRRYTAAHRHADKDDLTACVIRTRVFPFTGGDVTVVCDGVSDEVIESVHVRPQSVQALTQSVTLGGGDGGGKRECVRRCAP